MWGFPDTATETACDDIIRRHWRRRVNITFIVPCKDLSGGLKVVANYGNRLMERGHKVRVIYPKRAVSLKVRIKGAIRRWALRERDHLDFFEGELICVDQIHETVMPDADCIIATAFETALWIKDFSRRCGKKFYFIQGYETWANDKDMVDETFCYPFKKIVISSWLKDLVENVSGDKNIPVVPNGKDFSFSQNDIDGDRPYDIGLIYSEVAVKRSEVGLSAIERVAAEHPDLKVVCFGSVAPPPGRLPAGSTFFRKPSYRQIRRIYLSTRTWICSSRQEGFCLPALEAISLGCCVVSTDNLGIRDIITDGREGMIVPQDDAAALAGGVNRILNDVILEARLRTQGLKRSNDFSWDRSTTMFETCLTDADDRTVGKDRSFNTI